MLRRYSVNFALFSTLFDISSILVGMTFTYQMHSWLEILVPMIKRDGGHEIPSLFFLIFPVLWLFSNLGFSLYDGRRNVFFVTEAARLMMGTLFTTISMAGLLFFMLPGVAHSLLFSIILIAFAWMGLWRVAVRLYWRHQYSCNRDLRRVLIVGTRDTGQQIAEKLSGPLYPNYRVVGFLDDDHGESSQAPGILGTTKDLERIVSLYCVNIIVIALPPNAHDTTCNIVDRLRLMPVRIWVVPYATRLARFHPIAEYLDDTLVLDIRAPAISDRQRVVKRLFDLVAATMILLISTPIMLVIAILIKLDSPGPVFFRQKRVGENMQPFDMIKFRTMVQNAEALRAAVEKKDHQGNILHKHRDDPRITKIGRILRRYSLDELPQFINVLLGNMSIVGPRPELPCLVEKYKSWQYVRFTVPQGITGWWQVTGRSDKPLHLNTEDDFYYIQNYSFWLDIKILSKTFNAVLSGVGAF